MEALNMIAKQSWERVFCALLALHLVGKIGAKWAAPDLIPIQFAWLAPASVILLRLLAELPDGFARYAEQKKRNRPLFHQLSSIAPPYLAGFVSLYLVHLQACLRWVMGKAAFTPIRPGRVFHYYEKSQYHTAFVIAVLMGITDVPFGMLFLEVIEPDSARRQAIHAATLSLLLLAALWLLGDRQLVKATHYRVAPHCLVLRIGMRFIAYVSYGAIADAKLIDGHKELSEANHRWLQRHGFKPDETVICSPFDQPNLALTIHPSPHTRIVKGQMRREGIRHILVYVPEAAAFLNALKSQQAAVSQGC
jgi:hypothetical protein